jgi:hypothetical protein
MTRPGYVNRPSLPCADSVALMSAAPEALRIVGRDSYALGAPITSFWKGTSEAFRLELAATRLTIMRAARIGHYPTTEDMDVVNDRDGEWGWAHVNNADPLPFQGGR